MVTKTCELRAKLRLKPLKQVALVEVMERGDSHLCPSWEGVRRFGQRATELALAELGKLLDPTLPRRQAVPRGEQRLVCQPGLQVLFRPEEVGIPSAAPAEDHRLRRIDLDDSAAIDQHTHAMSAVGTRVKDCDPLVRVVAADQQQEVKRSGYVEALAILQLHGMVGEAKRPD